MTRTLTPSQVLAVDRLYEHDATILVAGTGEGKTVIALTSINELIENTVLRKVIVAAPAKVIEKMTWPNEAAKWDHLRKLRIVQLTGDATERTRRLLTTNGETHILMVSLNNLDWLLNQDHECDGIIIDELSKAAGKQTAGLKSKKKAGQLGWRVGMTATPVSQDFQKLYVMARIIDGGQSLGTNKQKFLGEYFYSDYMGYNWTLRDGADKRIMAKVKPLVHAIEDTKADKLPPIYHHEIRFDMPAATREVYNDMKKHMVAGDVEAANEAVKSGKLRQIASGFMYRTEDVHSAELLDTARYAAYQSWVDALMGRPGLVFYEYTYQENWGFVSRPDNVRFAQINSMSHGVDGLQHEFADVLFVQPVWSRDAAEQAVGRVWRTGQTKPVNVTTLICNDTLDDLVVERVEDRGVWMERFMEHLKG